MVKVDYSRYPSEQVEIETDAFFFADSNGCQPRGQHWQRFQDDLGSWWGFRMCVVLLRVRIERLILIPAFSLPGFDPMG